MPKRKKSKNDDQDLEYLRHKLRKLERKIRRRRKSSESSTYSATPDNESERSEDQALDPVLNPDLWVPPDIVEPEIIIADPDHQASTSEGTVKPQEGEGPSTSTAETQPDTAQPDTAQPGTAQPDTANELDSEILELLGDDPSAAVKYGPDIRKELASRLQHVATEGLSKENRKELLSKYLVPANCLHLAAPKINLEVKAAIPETFLKRDKGIETKQKQLACAISCLGEVISQQLNSPNKNNDLLQKLIDTARILCDLQHADTMTRRNFILFSLKKDMKEHVSNTKVDTFLFGENLSETLKSAKAVNKSGIDLKDSANKSAPKKTKTAVSRPLNRKAPPPRRQTGTTAAPARNREPAAPRAPPPAPAHSSTGSSQSHQQRFQHQQRRRY